MSIINMVKNLKEIHPEYVLCFKVGNFYHCYGKDAYIMAYLQNYNLKHTKEEIVTCGFPKQSIRKIMAKLEQKKINYITLDVKNEYDIEEKQDYKNLNSYEKTFNKANQYIRIKKKMGNLTEELLRNFEKENIIEKLKKIEELVYEE